MGVKLSSPSSMSIIACSSGSGEAGFAFALYAALARGGFGACASSSSSSEMTIPLLTRAVLLGSVRLDDDDGFVRAPVLSSSESESFRVGCFFSAGGWRPRRQPSSKEEEKNTAKRSEKKKNKNLGRRLGGLGFRFKSQFR